MRFQITLLLWLAFIALVAPAAFAASYDQPYSASDPCVGGLVEDPGSGRCTQPTGVCSVFPATYVKGPSPATAAGSPGGPVAEIEDLEGGSGVVENTSELYDVGWFSDWKASGIIGVAAAVAIIALAAAIGHAFNLPEVKAFVDSELMQAVISALLIGGLIALVGFFDAVSDEAIRTSQLPVTCIGSEPCYITSARFYLQTLYDTANGYAKDQLKESISKQKTASLGISAYGNLWWLGFSGGTYRPNAGVSIEGERAAAVFESASKLMADLHAQKYFIDVVAYGMAPIFLLLGIVLRTFFFTRKLGGLLLAIGISLFIVYPLTYAFAWYTLNVTVYGERMLGVSDAACPEECTMRYPVAFFVNETTGELMKFETTQAIMQAGISDDNLAQNGPDHDGDGLGDFPGFVSCRDLTSAGISNSTAQPQCDGCPDYCRDVPFPSNLPGCDIEKCSECNSGCKILRQRSDCWDPTVCANCPISCRTDLPIEDKCYFTTDTPTQTPVLSNPVQADLSIDCSGCSVCPAWCMFVTTANDNAELVHASEQGCSACADAFAEGTCPQKCMYVTDIGASGRCDEICTLDGVTCPKYCRVRELYYPEWRGTYDTTGFYDAYCAPANDPKIKAACELSACHDMCMVSAGLAPALEWCGAYPTTSLPPLCTGCPDYCRYQNFKFISPYSKTPVDASNTPLSCLPPSGEDEGVYCSNPECNDQCKATGSPEPPTCRQYDENDDADDLCRKCPVDARVTLTYTLASGGVVSGPPALEPEFLCADDKCSGLCRRQIALPNEADNPHCKEEGVPAEETIPASWLPNWLERHQGEGILACQYGCRVTGIDDADINKDCLEDQCVYMDPACKVALGGANSGYVCSEYLGNGPEPKKECTGEFFCDSLVENVCTTTPGCSWRDVYDCYGPPGSSCPNQNNEADCMENVGTCSGDTGCEAFTNYNSCYDNTCIWTPSCTWAQEGTTQVPIDDRSAPYDDRSACRQCPENCRISGGGSDCETGDATGIYTDCSLANCPEECRAEVPNLDPPTGTCQPYMEGGPCSDCPAAWRGGDYGSVASDRPTACSACPSECNLPAAPERTCEGCFDCPLDCNYFPAVRTDCSDICSDEALAGPVNIAPDDFIKKLPGAEGKSDVKGIGVLMIPALVLPLFCIVITIAFIRVFSPILGGDMEIPGLSRII